MLFRNKVPSAWQAAAAGALALSLGTGCSDKDDPPAQDLGVGANNMSMTPSMASATAGTGTTAAGGTGAAPAAAGSGSAGTAPEGTAGTPAAGASAAGGDPAAGAGGSPQAGAAAEAGTGAMAAAPDAGAAADPDAPDPSPGCMGGTLAAGHSNETIQVGSRQREYVQHVPSTYDGSKPFSVLIDFHGGTYDGPRWDARASNKFKDMSETEHFIYLAPTGLNAWWTTTDGAEGDDGLFIRALIDELKQNACIDNRRIYTTGCSMGGDMSFFMACYFSDVIAASLPMCGTMAFPLADCQPARPISMRFIMGSRDSLNCWEPPRTSVGNPCAMEVLDRFKTVNGCTDQAEMTHDGLCQTHDECEAGTEASICMLDATHTGIYQATDMDVYVEGWNFLKSYTLPR